MAIFGQTGGKLGLNIREHCLNRHGFRPQPGDSGIALDDEEASLTIGAIQNMQTCGGCYNEHPRFMRAASRETFQEVEAGSNLNGMRLVRTIRLSK